MLSIPVRGDGTIDDHEVAFLEGMAEWMALNGDGIFGSRPWKIYGEGPSTIEKAESGQFGGARDVRSKPYTPEDIRFTTKNAAVYAYLLAVPADSRAVIRSLATESPQSGGRKVSDVSLVGGGTCKWTQDAQGLAVTLPPEAAGRKHALALLIRGVV
jgi:alpha-L-fucosidase